MQASNIGCLKGSLYLHVYENNIYPQLAGAFVQLCCLKASLHVTLRLSRVSAFDIQNFALSGLQKTCRIAAMRQESRRSVRCRCDMPPAVKTIRRSARRVLRIRSAEMILTSLDSVEAFHS